MSSKNGEAPKKQATPAAPTLIGEQYKGLLANKQTGRVSGTATFFGAYERARLQLHKMADNCSQQPVWQLV